MDDIRINQRNETFKSSPLSFLEKERENKNKNKFISSLRKKYLETQFQEARFSKEKFIFDLLNKINENDLKACLYHINPNINLMSQLKLEYVESIKIFLEKNSNLIYLPVTYYSLYYIFIILFTNKEIAPKMLHQCNLVFLLCNIANFCDTNVLILILKILSLYLELIASDEENKKIHFQEEFTNFPYKKIIQFLNFPNEPANEDLLESVMCFIAAYMPMNEKFINILIEEDIITKCLNLAKINLSASTLTYYSYMISHLLQNIDELEYSKIILLLQVLKRLILIEEDEIRKENILSIGIIMEKIKPEEFNLSDIISDLNFDIIFENLGSKDTEMVENCLIFIGNFCSLNYACSDIIINKQIYNKILEILLNPINDSIAEKGFWVMTNITSGTLDQIKFLLKDNVFEKLLEGLKKNCKKPKALEEGMTAICLLTSTMDSSVLTKLLDKECLEILCQSLQYDLNKIQVTILTSIYQIIKKGDEAINSDLFSTRFEKIGGFDIIRNLNPSDKDSEKLCEDILGIEENAKEMHL